MSRVGAYSRVDAYSRGALNQSITVLTPSFTQDFFPDYLKAILFIFRTKIIDYSLPVRLRLEKTFYFLVLLNQISQENDILTYLIGYSLKQCERKIF